MLNPIPWWQEILHTVLVIERECMKPVLSLLNQHKKPIEVVLTTILIGIVLWYLYQNIADLQKHTFSVKPSLLLVSLVFVWVWMMVSAWIYHILVTRLHPAARFGDNLAIWSKSFLGRYIPGKVGVISSRVYYHKQLGISAKKTSFIFFVETILTLLSSALIFVLVTLVSDIPVIASYRWASVAVVFAFLISLHPALLQFLIRTLYKIVKKEAKHPDIPYSYWLYLSLIGLNVIKWLVVGLGLYLLILSVTPLNPSYILYVTGAYAVAGIIGFLSFFTPSGLGVIEGIMTYALGFIMPAGVAALVSILIRIWKTIGEITFIGLLFVIAFLKKNLQNN